MDLELSRRSDDATPNKASPDYSGEALEKLNRINFELTNIFSDAGFAPIEPAILQSADLLFDLYGEEIWERAFIIEDTETGQMCLRPDFTVPVALAHLAHLAQSNGSAKEARFGYFGPVFRRPAEGAGVNGPVQHLQAGVEVIDTESTVERDAEIFELTCKALNWCGCEKYDVMTGDLNIAFSLLKTIKMPEGWRRRLIRHFWRPKRFSEILRGYAGERSESEKSRLAFLKGFGALEPSQASTAVMEMITMSETPQIGVRTAREVSDRFLRHAVDATKQPLSEETVELIETILNVRGSSVEALNRMRDITRAASIDLSSALDTFSARLDALTAHGVDAHTLPFDAAFGRNLEYYDGFVFETYAWEPVGDEKRGAKLGGGGRYNRLFQALDGAAGLCGVGAALRPEAIIEAIGLENVSASPTRAPEQVAHQMEPTFEAPKDSFEAVEPAPGAEDEEEELAWFEPPASAPKTSGYTKHRPNRSRQWNRTTPREDETPKEDAPERPSEAAPKRAQAEPDAKPKEAPKAQEISSKRDYTEADMRRGDQGLTDEEFHGGGFSKPPMIDDIEDEESVLDLNEEQGDDDAPVWTDPKGPFSGGRGGR